MALLLNVPYVEKDQAKALGAKWNPELKRWYADVPRDYYKFRKWFSDPKANLVVCNQIYIVVGKDRCFRCKNDTNVISLAVDAYDNLKGTPSSFCDGDIHFIEDIENPPEALQKYLLDNHRYYKGYSKTTQNYYFGNHCEHCGTLQGNYYLYHEIDSLFWIQSASQAASLTVYCIPLPYDLELRATVRWGEDDYLINEYAEFIDLDLDL